MGLLSFLNKNKQEDGMGRDEDALAAARSKRPSHAGGRAGKPGADPLLPEKKRARRRLVGAFALALAAAIGLPMILDSEPKQLATDIDIRIPSKDKAAPLPAPAAPAMAAASAALDPKEEIVAAPSAAPAAAPAAAAAAPEAVKPADPAPVAKLEVKPEAAKAEPAKVEPPKPAKPEAPKLADTKHESKHDTKPAAKAEAKPEAKAPAKPNDDVRALAILEGKQAEKAAADSHKYVVQVGAFRDEKVAEVQSKLKAAGISSFTQKIPGGELTRVRVGPFPNREEADKAHAKIKALGLGGSVMSA